MRSLSPWPAPGSADCTSDRQESPALVAPGGTRRPGPHGDHTGQRAELTFGVDQRRHDVAVVAQAQGESIPSANRSDSKRVTRPTSPTATHLCGAGLFDPVDGERFRVRVILATGLPEATVRAINLGYRDPTEVDPGDWSGARSLAVPDPGGVLYQLRRLRRAPHPKECRQVQRIPSDVSRPPRATLRPPGAEQSGNRSCRSLQRGGNLRGQVVADLCVPDGDGHQHDGWRGAKQLDGQCDEAGRVKGM